MIKNKVSKVLMATALGTLAVTLATAPPAALGPVLAIRAAGGEFAARQRQLVIAVLEFAQIDDFSIMRLP